MALASGEAQPAARLRHALRHALAVEVGNTELDLPEEVARHLKQVDGVSRVPSEIALQAGTPCNRSGPFVLPWNIVDNINLKASRR